MRKEKRAKDIFGQSCVGSGLYVLTEWLWAALWALIITVTEGRCQW